MTLGLKFLIFTLASVLSGLIRYCIYNHSHGLPELANIFDEMQKKAFAIKEHHEVHIVTHQDISYCKAEGRYTRIVLCGGKSYMVAKLISCVAESLPKDTFFRTHKSFIININEITSYNSAKRCCVLMNGDFSLKVSRRRETAFKKFLFSNLQMI